jgi:hypothetical protein
MDNMEVYCFRLIKNIPLRQWCQKWDMVEKNKKYNSISILLALKIKVNFFFIQSYLFFKMIISYNKLFFNVSEEFY